MYCMQCLFESKYINSRSLNDKNRWIIKKVMVLKKLFPHLATRGTYSPGGLKVRWSVAWANIVVPPVTSCIRFTFLIKGNQQAVKLARLVTFGAVDEPLVPYLMVDFWAMFLNWQLVGEIGVVDMVFSVGFLPFFMFLYIPQVLNVIFFCICFYSEIRF